MIEALACGTPVIARPCGSVPEVLRHGVTGVMASDVDSLVRAVQAITSISRQKCRAEFENRFTADVMTTNYEKIYCQLMDRGCTEVRHNEGGSRRKVPEVDRSIGRIGDETLRLRN
jgi:glycosyltransferase involved in cell wall biosynthesis